MPVFCIVLGAARLAAAEDRQPAPEHHWRSLPFCGVNTTYTLLKMYDRDVKHGEIQAAIPVTEAGSSMKTMKDVLVQNGLPARVIVARPEQLSRLPLPVIAHLESDSTSLFRYNTRGHYVVLFEVRAENMRYIDGTTGVIVTVSRPDFVANWSGHLIVVDSRQSRIARILPAGVGLLCVGFLSLLALRRRASRKNQ